MLSQTSRYALASLATIARHDTDEVPLRSADLASRLRVPHDYLAKVLRRLVVGGLLTSRKGHGGGFRLARPAHQIPIEEILSLLEEVPDQERCAFGRGLCSSRRACPLHGLWQEALDQALAWARSRSLGDLADPEVFQVAEA